MRTLTAVWEILTPSQRTRAFALLGLMLIGMVFELIGIGMVIPALAFMVQEPTAISGMLPKAIDDWVLRTPPHELLLYGLGALLAVYVLKSVFLAFLAYSQARFVAGVQAVLSERLFTGYLGQPWQYHLRHNSAELVRNIDNVQGFAITCTMLLILTAESLVICGIIGLLVWCEPMGAVVVAAVLGTSTFIYDRITRNRLGRWGTLRYQHAAEYLKHMQQGLGGAKDVKVLGCEHHFIRRFAYHVNVMARMAGRQSLFQQIPRLWYELLAVAALCILTAVMLWQGRPMRAFVPTLGLFATAAFRLLPSVNRLAMAVQQIRFGQAQTETLRAELQDTRDFLGTARVSPLGIGRAVRLADVTYRYEGGHANALSNVSLVIPRGQSIGFIGESGSGKSTLVDVILGLLPPMSGNVLVDDVDIHDNLSGWLANVGYVPQSIFLTDDTIRRNVAFGVDDECVDETAVDRAIRAARLDEFVGSLPAGKQTVVGERGVRLSGGQRQRIGIARALYRDPQVLILDEATSALDGPTEKEVMAAVNALHGQKTLIIVAHRLTTVANCDVLYRLENGRVVASGRLADVCQDAGLDVEKPAGVRNWDCAS
jgi:ATP-binding cassette, subfamily B, bacterial PglK